MFHFCITYKHTFKTDFVFALNKRKAKEKAIKILKAEFQNAIFPLHGVSYGKPFVAYQIEDLIEDIQ